MLLKSVEAFDLQSAVFNLLGCQDGKCIALSAMNLLAPSATFLLALIAAMRTRIYRDSVFSWQAQHLVMLEADTCPSPHCK